MTIHTHRCEADDGGYKYPQVLPDICLIISAPYNESIKVLKNSSKNTAQLRSCNRKVGVLANSKFNKIIIRLTDASMKPDMHTPLKVMTPSIPYKESFCALRE